MKTQNNRQEVGDDWSEATVLSALMTSIAETAYSYWIW